MGWVYFALGFISCIGAQLVLARLLAAGQNSKMPIKETINITKG